MATTNINVTTTAQDLQSVTDVDNITTNNIELDNSAIVLNNGSLLQKGTVDNGAGGGIARVCSIGYQDEWENGIQYFVDNNSGQIIRANSINNTVPGINDDITKGYIVGSIFFDMNNQNKYICTDNTDGAAVWDSFIDEPQNLQEVTDQGNLTTNAIQVGNLAGLYSEISGSTVGTASVPNGTYAYMSQDGVFGMNNGAVESALKNTNVSTGNNVILEFPDKTSGSYTIATTADIPAATNFGLFAQTANSTTITNTTTESTLIGTGVGSLSSPANAFEIGDSFHAKLIGHISCNNSATIHLRVKSGSVLLADTGVIALDTTTNKRWEINVYFTIRALGAAGVASIASGGIFSYIKNSGLNFEGNNFSIVNDTTFDTTINNTLNITAQWGAANAADSIYSEIFILNKIY